MKDLASVVETRRVELPSGYVYADAAAISLDERRKLDAEVNGPFDSPLNRADWSIRGFGITGCIDVGVRNIADEELVGIGRLLVTDHAGARIDINLLSGELSHFMVNPAHRKRGIGTAILLERMRIAEGLEVYKLFISALDKRNTLCGKYPELGFEEDSRGNLWLDKRSSMTAA